ncbi:MAG: hypothetical protein ACI9PC_001458, partial [Porticoccaceae bacterium]
YYVQKCTYRVGNLESWFIYGLWSDAMAAKR